MIQLTGTPKIDSSPAALPDISRRTPDRDREPRNKASAPPVNSACAVADCWYPPTPRPWNGTSQARR